MIRYKIDIMKTLADSGYTRQRLRDTKTLSQGTIQTITDAWRVQTLTEEQIQRDPRLCKRIDDGIKGLSLDTINRICVMCGKKIEDVVEVVPTDEEILHYYKIRSGHV